MGNELKCTARIGKQQSAGKALLETSEIIFRGAFRLKIPFAAIQSLKVVGFSSTHTALKFVIPLSKR